MPLHRGFRLGDVDIRPVEGLLDGPAGSASVHPHAMEVLLYLAARPGELVSRDEILAAVWGQNSVNQESLTRNVTELRHALGDDAHHPTFIQTVPRQGYRLVAPVIPLETEEPGQLTEVDVGFFRTWWSELKRRRIFKIMPAYAFIAWGAVQVADIFAPMFLDNPTTFIAVTMVVAATGAPVTLFLSWVLQVTDGRIVFDQNTALLGGKTVKILPLLIWVVSVTAVAVVTYLLVRAPFVDGRVRIAVLPLLTIGVDDNNVFCSGLTQDLTFMMGRIPELKVAPQLATSRFQNTAIQQADIAKRLNVTHLVEGSCRFDKDQIRINAQLVDAKSGFTLWSRAYVATPENIFQVQEDIARKVARSLRLVLSKGTNRELDFEPTQSGDAYAAYLMARGFLVRSRTEGNLASAQSLFEEAVKLDSAYADAYAGLCETHLAFYELLRDVEYFQNADRACQIAMVKSRGSVEVHHALGELYRRAGQYEKSLTEFQKVIGQDPSFADGHVGKARVLAELNMLDQSEAEFLAAIVEDPVYWVSINAYGAFLMRRARYDEAVKQFRKVVVLDPGSALAYNNLGAASAMAGEFGSAGDALERANALEPDAAALFNSGTMYFYSGDFEKAQKLYRKAVELTPEDYRIWGGLGDALHALNATEAAAAAYTRAKELARSSLEVNPEDHITRAALAHYMARSGNLQDAEIAIKEAVESVPDDMDVRYYEALVKLELGWMDQVYEAIAAALEAGYPRALMAADPAFESLRGDPRFRKLLE